MKQNILKRYASFVIAFMLIGFYSCEKDNIEPVQEEGEISAKKGPRSGSGTFDLSQECSTSDSVNLYAGQNILVGTIDIVVNGDNYVINYNLTNADYCITETHLSVVDSPNDFPLNGGGNPKIGHFEYNDSHECESSVSYTVPTSKGAYIAAHAVVNCINDVSTDAYALTLPDQVDVCVTEKGVTPSYFDISIADGNSLSGAYEAWCIDTDTGLNNGQCFVGDVYSSYEPLPDGKFEQPGNFGAVNWLINQNFIGTESNPELGNYTFGDIQLAVWSLIDDEVCLDCSTGPYDLDRVNLLVSMALGNNDYVPGCGENVVIVIIPTTNLQSIFISIPAPCDECEETAWGDGCEFPGNSWATYFHYQSAG